jgi:hypothetical protein
MTTSLPSPCLSPLWHGPSLALKPVCRENLRLFINLTFFDFLRMPDKQDSCIFQRAIARRFLIMLPVISALLAFVAGLFRSWASLCLEYLALQDQLAVYKQTVYRS